MIIAQGKLESRLQLENQRGGVGGREAAGRQVVIREVPAYVEREVPVERVVTVEKRVEVPVEIDRVRAAHCPDAAP